MKKNYISPAIDTMILGFSLMQTNDASANNSITNGMSNPFGAPKRERPF